jgi:dUTP pyrophosphatase
MAKRGFQALPAFKGKITMPRRQTTFSAGYDIHSAQDALIEPMEMKVIRTGLTAYMENDEELQLRPRSGLAYKHMITLMNCVGTIDADYFGQEIKLLMVNYGSEPFEIKQGDRIAQGVFAKYLKTDDDVPVNSERKGGFGSTKK